MDKDLFENLLTLDKNLCTLLLHGTLEAANDEVYNAFKDSLFEALDVQHAIYKAMEQQSFYQVENVQQHEVEVLQDKFQNCCW